MSYRDFKGVMRPDQNKRHRGRNNGNNSNNSSNRGPRPLHRMQTLDSSGPNAKIRGPANQVFERYVALAREAATSGDQIAAENLYQHAEHYFRLMNAEGQNPNIAPRRPMTPADGEMSGGDGEGEAWPRLGQAKDTDGSCLTVAAARP
jgi:hypothetical protein